jgi:hypothetical protein
VLEHPGHSVPRAYIAIRLLFWREATSKMECVICHKTKDPDEVVKLDCSHRHCRECLYHNLLVSLDEVPFRPVRCCSRQAIKTAALRSLVFRQAKQEELQLYRELLAKYHSPDRLYCYDPKCNTFIPTVLRTRRNGKCPRCLAKTCAFCRQK